MSLLRVLLALCLVVNTPSALFIPHETRVIVKRRIFLAGIATPTSRVASPRRPHGWLE